MRPALPTVFALRRDLLRVRSFGDMLDVLRGNTAEPPSSTKELAEPRVQNANLTRDNQAPLRRLEPALTSSTRFEHDLATVVPERDEWKRHATKTSELVASFRNTVCVLELQMRESSRQANRRVHFCQQPVDHLRRMVDQRDKDLKRMSEVLAERDVAYSALQVVASSYFEQVQAAAAIISSGGADRALGFANQTIDNQRRVIQRRVIQRQKNILRHNGWISVTDPALALVAAAGFDAPGLSPGDLALNARLCRLLEARRPELSQVQPSEVREITLRVSGPMAPSSAPVSLPLSSAAPTSNSSAAGLAMPPPADFPVPSAEPRRVPGSPFRRDHLTPVTRASVHVSASSSVPRSGSAASAAPAASSAGLVSSTVVTSVPESTDRPLPAVSAGLVSSTPPSTRRTSPQATKASAGSTSKSARMSPAKAAAGSSRRAPRNSAASPKSTSIVAPAPSITGSTQSQRASALNARAINNLELQALEASDAEVLGWSSGAANSAARATSASSPLVVDSPSPPVATPTPAPAGASSSQRQSSSDDSADDEVALQRSCRLRKKSVVESDESSDAAAEALEEKPASPLTPASVPPTPSTGQKRPSSPVIPASTKKARASASAKSSNPPRPVAKSTSRVRPTAKSSKAAKSATKTARGIAKSGKSAKSADPPTPASGQSASASGTAAVSAPTSSASSGQASNSAGATTSFPDVLRLPILTVRTRAAQAVSRDSRCWLKCRGDRPAMAKVFVALYERMHWLVDSSVVLGLHPDLNPTSSADELALVYQLWQKYSHERKRHSDALRSVLTELYGTLYKAVTEFDAASNTPAPQLDSELYFDPSVPFAPPANLPWFPTSADWCELTNVNVGR
ncbi:unnamed protein product [Phytophthora fragariaefolia]|uniref:Unnamed protein product n=1 Tax=Phytophthora fragariaefolia TaxID=1490495 RepID=A0A9W6XQM9_9STRA|nr:unnamed protein product [Phytophthora fragariaefolia]